MISCLYGYKTKHKIRVLFNNKHIESSTALFVIELFIFDHNVNLIICISENNIGQFFINSD